MELNLKEAVSLRRFFFIDFDRGDIPLVGPGIGIEGWLGGSCPVVIITMASTFSS